MTLSPPPNDENWPLCGRCGRQMDGPGHECPTLGMELLRNGLVRVFWYGPGTWALFDPETDDWRYGAPGIYADADAERVREWLVESGHARTT